MNVYRHGYNSPLPQNTDGRTEALGGGWSVILTPVPPPLWLPGPSGAHSLQGQILNPRSRVLLPLTL